MTSNLGSDIIREKFSKIDRYNADEIIEDTKLLVFDLLKKVMRPEFLNRIDDTIVFQPLTEKNIRAIVKLQMKGVEATLAKQEIKLTVTPQVLRWLAEEGYNPEFGARPVKRVIQKKVLHELSKQILLGKVNPKSHVVLDVFDDKIVFRAPIREEAVVNES